MSPFETQVAPSRPAQLEASVADDVGMIECFGRPVRNVWLRVMVTLFTSVGRVLCEDFTRSHAGIGSGSPTKRWRLSCPVDIARLSLDSRC